MVSIVIHRFLGMRHLNLRDGLSLDHLKPNKDRGSVMVRIVFEILTNLQLEVVVPQLLVSMRKEPAMKQYV